jgi:cell division protein FtsN
MRFFACLSIISLLFAASCAQKRRSVSNSSVMYSYDSIPGITIKRSQIPAVMGRKVEEEPVRQAEEDIFKDTEEEPVRGVEEKLVANDEKEPGPEKYFVIIGSFRDPLNAIERQSEVIKEGFESEILKNEAGLYRVSVMATDDINAAKDGVRKIWAKYPQYFDAWMLIRKDQ